MKLTLPPEVLKGLPSPASDDGVVRVNVGLKVGSDGSVDLVEMNDSPLPVGTDEEDLEEEAPVDPMEEGAEMEDYAQSATDQIGQL